MSREPSFSGAGLSIGLTLYVLEERRSAVEWMVSAVEERRSTVDERVSSVDGRVLSLEKRLSAVEVRLSAVDERLTAVEERLSMVEEKTSEFGEKRLSSPTDDGRVEAGGDLRSKVAEEAPPKFDEVFGAGSTGSSENKPSSFAAVATLVGGITYEVAKGGLAMRVKPRPIRKYGHVTPEREKERI